MRRLVRLQPSRDDLFVVLPQGKIVIRNKPSRGLRLKNLDELRVLKVVFLQPDRKPDRVFGEHDIVEKEWHGYVTWGLLGLLLGLALMYLFGVSA